VNSIEYYDNANEFMDIHVIPDTWITRAAYRRAKGIFDGMNEFALRNSGDIYPKYHDFKVYMSNLHRNTGTTAPSLYAVNQVPTVINSDDWEYSQFVSADDDQDGINNADNFYGHMVGANAGSPDNWGSIGLILSYGDTRARANQSNPVVDAGYSTDPLANLMDFSSEEQLNDIITRLDDDNDEPPYDNDVYVGQGNHMNHVARLVTTAATGRVAIGAGFCAPLGLIAVDPPDGYAGGDFRIVLNLAVGTYHGVYAEQM
jgi:hypothetical protein